MVNWRLRDGYEFRGRSLYIYESNYFINTSVGYLIVPCIDVEHSWVDLEDFKEAQQKAKDLSKYKWSEV